MSVARDGRLLICDSPRGLLAMDPDTGTLDVLVDTVDGRRLKFCSNVTESPDGAIYFTESTAAFSYAHFKAPILEARGDGPCSVAIPTVRSPRWPAVCTSRTA